MKRLKKKGAYKYRFGLQKRVKKQKYFPEFGKYGYDVSAFQCTFDHVYIFTIGEATSD